MGGKTWETQRAVHHGFNRRVRLFRSDKRFGSVTAAAVVIAVALLLVGAVFAPLGAQTYPNKPVRFVMPYPTGGATDILGRMISQKLAERLDQPFVPENRPGAGSNIGNEVVAKARPDGYTILLGSSSLSISPTLYKKLNYDVIKDFAPIAMVARTALVLVVRSALPVKSLKELVEYAKTNPGKLNYGSSGIGGPGHLACELFQTLAKIKLVHVPYKGAGQAMVAMMGNEVDMVVMVIAASLPPIRAGKIRALAVLSEHREPSLPDVPTAKEAGIDNFEVPQWYGILAPAGTPAEIISRLNREWGAIAAMPDIKEKLRKSEFKPVSGSPEQFDQFIRTEIARWGKVIKDANLSVD